MKRQIAGGVLILLTSTADAADPDYGNRISASLATCRTIEADPARLACFDRAAAAFEQAVASKDIRIVDKQDVRRARRSLFGFPLPRIGLFSNAEAGDDKEETKAVDTTIAAIVPLGYGQYDLRMADGSTWRTTEALTRPPRSGAQVHIGKGAIGNFFLRVEKGRPVRAQRVQ